MRKAFAITVGFLLVFFSVGCFGADNGSGLDEYWETRFSDSTVGGTKYVSVIGLTEKGKEQTFLVFPAMISGYHVRFEGTKDFSSHYSFDFGSKLKGVVFERSYYSAVENTGRFRNSSFDWLYFLGAENLPIKRDAFHGQEIPQYPVIVPDIVDIEGRLAGMYGWDYEGINFQRLSDSLTEYKMPDGSLWSLFTDERNLVFEKGIELYKSELIIIASEEIETITFPESVNEISKIKIVLSEKQPEGAKITVNIPNGTNLSDSAFADDAEIVEIVRY
jgi:hypothetical protein